MPQDGKTGKWLITTAAREQRLAGGKKGTEGMKMGVLLQMEVADPVSQ